MTSPHDESSERVDLAKSGEPTSGAPDQPAVDPAEPLDFDPYRFGLPDHPVPPEFAPPGYVPPEPAAPAEPWSPYGPSSPYGSTPPPPAWPNGPSGPPGPAQGGQYGGGQYGAGPGQYGGGPGPYGAGPGQYGPGQYPPGYPLNPGGYGYPAPGTPGAGATHNHGKAVAAMVCGIASIVLCWLTLFDAALVVPGLVLSIIVIKDRRSAGRGMAIAGLVCSIIGAVAAIALLVWLAPIVHDCSGLNNSDQQQCIEDKI